MKKKTSHISQLCIALLSVLFIAVSCDKDTEPWSLAPEVAIQVDEPSIERTKATVIANARKLIRPEDDPDGMNIQAWGIEYSKNIGFSNDAQTHVIVRHNLSDTRFELDSLTDTRQYYVRTFATSILLAEGKTDGKNVEHINSSITAYNIAYSDYVTFTTKASGAPSLSDLTYSNVTATSADISANITDNGGFPVNECGYIYIPLESGEELQRLTSTTRNRRGNQAQTITFENTKTLTPATITGLTSSTRYAVCAYAVNDHYYTGYGRIEYFTTERTSVPELAGITVDESRSEGVGTLYIQSGITNPGTSAITRRGFVYISSDVSSEPLIDRTIGEDPIVITDGSDNNFGTIIRNLEIGKTYYFRSFAENEHGPGYGAILSLTVEGQPDAPSVELLVAEVDSLVYGRFMAFITNNGGAAIAGHGFVISSTDELPEVGKDNCEDIVVEGTGYRYETPERFQRFEENTTYYVRAYAYSKNGSTSLYGYSEPLSFTTGILQIIPGQGDNPYPGTEGGQNVGGEDNPYPETGSKKR